MYIQNNKASFQALYRAQSIKTVLNESTNREIKSELSAIERGIRKNNLHKKDNVDIYLGYSEKDGFYGVISSKKQGTPINPASICNVSKDKNSINKFSQWATTWNEAYSPQELKKFRDLMNFIKNGLKKEN